MAKNAVLIFSVALSAIIGIWSVVAPDQVTGASVALTSGALNYLDWMFMLALLFSDFTCFCDNRRYSRE